MPDRPSRPRALRAGLIALAAVILATVATGAAPGPASASTETSMESSLQTWINRDRVDRGLRPLRLDLRLVELAGERASWMAAHDRLTHDSVDGTVCDALTARAIRWHSCGENIGYTTYPWGPEAAASLYSMWEHSPAHWALLMSSQFNYIGIGTAYRSASATTYATIAFLEGADRTAPWGRMRTKSVSGTTIRFTWAGSDPLLQTHTAGLRDFNVRYRVDGGAWTQVRTATTATSITLSSRRHGHYYWVRVQARDRQGNLSSWSAGLRVWVP